MERRFGRPGIMPDYPKEIKAFYMKQNEDGRTVQGTDVLFPQIGEILGGSVREESYDKLILSPGAKAMIPENTGPKRTTSSTIPGCR